ncbi:MAG TPA: endonuclease/exonuclease/phosphatase family protein [bacterium]|jgi:endonuclease/exonuclease/phosphatase family metal-dependent hydrolase
MNLRRFPLYAVVALCFLIVLDASARDSAVRVMTYNIRYDNPADSLDNWKYRKNFVVSTVRYHAPDVFGIQEGLISQVHDLSAALRGFRWCGKGRDDGAEAGEFSAIFYDATRFVLLKDSTFWLSPTPDKPSKGWDAALNRIVTWAKLQDKQTRRVFFVFNTHFDHMGVTAREESAKLLLRQIRHIAKDKPAVVTGDFNSTDTEAPYAALTAKDSSKAIHLADALTICESPHHGPLKTFSGFDVHKGLIGDRIDFVFVSDGVRVIRHATLADFKSDERFPSDHLPVIAEIALP